MKKILIVGGLGVAGYFLWKHFSAAGQIADLANSTNPAGTGVPVDQTISAGGQAGQIPDPGQLQALISWSDLTPNPPLYKAMFNELDAADIASMYDILTNAWNAGKSPSAVETTFWNGLVARYPFLTTKGQGYTTFTS